MEDLLKEYQRRLVLMSFSKTISNTEQKNLLEFNLEESYYSVISMMFGQKGLNKLMEYGGIQGRSPAEVIMSLVYQSTLSSELKDYANKNNIDLYSERQDPISALVKSFAKNNAKILTKSIGTPCSNGELWPPLYNQVNIFLSQFENHNIDLGIISSGHEVFIRKVFEYYGMYQPLFCITPDDKFEFCGMDWASGTKPSTLLIAQALSKWIETLPNEFVKFMNGQNQNLLNYASENTIYIGDDLELDGKMAMSKGIRFWLFDPTATEESSFQNGYRLFSDYEQLIKALKTDKLFI